MSNIRDEKGRLLPGHPCISPGRPPREKELAILETIRQEATPERVAAVLGKLYDQVMEHGSVKAAQLWLAYCAGQPKQLEALTPGQANVDMMRKAMLEFERNQQLAARITELEAQVNMKTIEVNK